MGESESAFAARREEFRKTLPKGVELMPDHVTKSLSPKVYEAPKILFFHEMMPSFANILADETTASGAGWEITTAGRRLINLATEELQLKRDKSIKEGRRELTKSETIALWKRIFNDERESEEKLCEILDQVFSPDQFLESQRILGEADANESITDLLNRVPIESYRLFMNSVPSLEPLNIRR